MGIALKGGDNCLCAGIIFEHLLDVHDKNLDTSMLFDASLRIEFSLRLPFANVFLNVVWEWFFHSWDCILPLMSNVMK